MTMPLTRRQLFEVIRDLDEHFDGVGMSPFVKRAWGLAKAELRNRYASQPALVQNAVDAREQAQKALDGLEAQSVPGPHARDER